jgi:hypothetical protein
MNNKNKLISIEKNFDWKGAINFMNDLISGENLNKEYSYRVIFLLSYFCSDLPHSKDDLRQVSISLKVFLEESNEFLDDPEYLAFTGIAIYMSYFYIGYKDISEAKKRIQKAIEICPKNELYKWLLHFVQNQNPDSDKEYKAELINNILKDKYIYIKWLNDKGLVGSYLMGMIFK